MSDRVVLVEWIDSQMSSGWHELEDNDLEVPTCRTVGFLVGGTPDVLAVAASKNENNGYVDAVLAIPKVCVLKIYELGSIGEWNQINTSTNER